MEEKSDVIVVGGGATGAGIARDLSLRGVSVVLLEKNDISEGTTGRCHAMLHSGARYVYKDSEAASDCAIETEIILKIAPHITQACGGYFIGIDEDDVAYAPKFVTACKAAHVFVEEQTPIEFLKMEPNCNPATQKVYRVKDGYVDPFLLTIYNAYDAQLHGAQVRTYCEVTKLLMENERVCGVEYYDRLRNETKQVKAKIIINATGPWAAKLEQQLNLPEKLQICPTMGTLLVIKPRLVNALINRLRPPGDGDIIVPSHQTILLGTTSVAVTEQQLDHLSTTSGEIEYIIKLGEKLIPALRKYRIIRYYSGARPLIASKGSLREASRKFDIIDYEKADHPGLITIFGGKLTTYRLMAEKTSDLICKKLGIKEKCITAIQSLPGGERIVSEQDFKALFHVDDKSSFDMALKWGTFYTEIAQTCNSCSLEYASFDSAKRICECENITNSELEWVLNHLSPRHLDDYRRRTRQAMGPCQGQFCYFKIANFLAQQTDKTHQQILNELKEALNKRWKTENAGDAFLKRQIKLAKYMYLMGGNIN